MSRLAQWLRNAYEDHSRDEFERALLEVEQLVQRDQQRRIAMPTPVSVLADADPPPLASHQEP